LRITCSRTTQPWSVGALMDPVFLRNAMLDANGNRRDEAETLATSRWRWRGTIRAIAAAFRRH